MRYIVFLKNVWNQIQTWIFRSIYNQILNDMSRLWTETVVDGSRKEREINNVFW